MPELIFTDDGSASLYDQTLNETYHSTKGAVQESMHVFIQNGLLAFSHKTQLAIFEMGFGTGLNALLTFAHKPSAQKIYYHSIEKFPLSNTILEKLNYSSLCSDKLFFQDIVYQPFNTWKNLRPDFLLYKQAIDLLLLNKIQPNFFDLIYYDAFAPKTQPELWSAKTMKFCNTILKPGGILVTYCAQGQFKRNLKEAGFEVMGLPGPPGKREITRAIKI